MAESFQDSPSGRGVCTKHAGRGIWLVKVPKYISKKWEKAPGNIEVAKLKIMRNEGNNVDISMTMAESMLCMNSDDGKPEVIPKNYKLNIGTVKNQVLEVFSQTPDDNNPGHEKLALEGGVLHKLECHPLFDDTYMKMKMEAFKNAHKPVRPVQKLTRLVQSYKPVSTHKFLKDEADKKKAEGKRSRSDKSDVLDMIFKAFEKHQYYTIKDLVLITKQPVGYLKEILKEVCNHNLKTPHKNMWELKPEYRHYNKVEASQANPDQPSSSSSM